MRLALAAAAGLLLSILPSSAKVVEVHYYADQAHGIEVGAYHPASSPGIASAAEVSMVVGRTEVVLSSDPEAEIPETGGCVDVLVGSVIDSGCGPLTITTDGMMGTTRVVGDIASTEYEYISDPFSFEEVGPSVIHLDLTFTGTGEITTQPGGNPILVGVCGLPPDTRGVSVLAHLFLQRPAVATGTFVSEAAGPIEPASLLPTMVEARGLEGGACLP